MTDPSAHHLVVQTTPITSAPPLTEVLDRDHPLVWRRRGAGIVGYGEVLRLTFTGEHRIRDAAAAWRELSSRAQIANNVGVTGTGLVAFGTFAFADDSKSTSVLIVPQVIIGRRDGVTWLTVIQDSDAVNAGEIDVSGAPDDIAARIMSVSALGARPHVVLRPGMQSADGYRHAVSSAVARIVGGEASKVVLARDLVGTISGESDLRPVIIDLAQGYPDCWTFSIDGLIGASPETLVAVAATTVDARVLAGTAARGSDPQHDLDAATMLATSTKDIDEHAFAVRSVVDALTPLTTTLRTSEAFTLKLPNVWHIATDVSGSLADGTSSLDLVGALHPTAAVAGTPTRTALGIIGELEPFDRGRYAGAVGWVGANGDGEWGVALRCMQVENLADGTRDVTAHAGAGIVVDSRSDSELIETTMKFRPIVDALSSARD